MDVGDRALRWKSEAYLISKLFYLVKKDAYWGHKSQAVLRIAGMHLGQWC